MSTGNPTEQLDVSSRSQEKEAPQLVGVSWGSQKKVASFSPLGVARSFQKTENWKRVCTMPLYY